MKIIIGLSILFRALLYTRKWL